MTRNVTRRSRKSKQHGGVIRHVIGLFTAFLLGYLTANVLDIKSILTWINQHWTTEQASDVGKSAVAVAKKVEPPKPKFEFYTLLSKNNAAPSEVHQFASAHQDQLVANQAVVEPTAPVSHPVVAETPAAPAAVAVIESQPLGSASTSAATVATRETYMIQVAAVTRRQDAERLKSSLSSKGYSVMIISPSTQAGNWFRVVIGPFHSRADAERTQQMVSHNEHLQGMIKKVDV